VIPFNKPYVPEASKKYALEALESNHQQGDGTFTEKVSKIVSGLVGGGYVLLTPSCTHALEMASMLANIGPGDEVILPSYTFTSSATAITQFGATPVFVDIDPITKVIDVNQVAEAITDKTVAISWVNYAGVAPDIDILKATATANGLFLIEDNAHGLGGSYKGKPLGSFGDFATQSFHATKNIQCGEGGALVVNNETFLERAKIIREKGTDRSKYLSGHVEKYQWVDKGSSYLLAETLSAVLLGQLEEFSKIQDVRTKIWKMYKAGFASYLDSSSNWNEHGEVAHMFYLEITNQESRTQLLNHLKKFEVQATFHYQPLIDSIAGRKLARSTGTYEISRHFSKTIARLPLWVGMTDEMVQEVILLSMGSKALGL